jgi:hypothetical protein
VSRVIRNVVVGRLRPAADTESAARDRAQLEEGLAGIRTLNLPGMVANVAGRDIGLRDGGWDFAITNDWQDEASYRGYDTDEEHNRYRALVGGVCEQVVRVQVELDEA